MSLNLLGPLTTTWSAPATCSLLFAYPDKTSNLIAYRGQRCAVDEARDGSDCWPPRKEGIPDKASAVQGWGFYSPGLVCPVGYTTACSAVFGQRPDWEAQFPLVPGETAVGCCPTGYTCTSWYLDGNSCYNVPTETTLTTAVCGQGGISQKGEYVWPATVSVAVPGGTSATISTLWAPMFQLNFKQSDLSNHAQASTAPRSDWTPAATASPKTWAPVEDPSPSLSDGQIAGIAVGAVVAGLVIVALVIVIFRHRRRQMAMRSAAVQDSTHALPGAKLNGWEGNREWHSQQPEPQEILSPAVLAELPAQR